MNEVFISYSRKDKAFVEKLHEALQQHERKTWVDWQGIPPTAEWLAEIYRAIEAADAFVFVISPDSVRSSVCKLEIEHAALYKKRLIPLLCETTESALIHPAIAAHNWIDFSTDTAFTAAFERLKLALDTDFAYAQAHTRLLVRALQWHNAARNVSFALRGSELEQAERWLAESPNKTPAPHELHTQYITASVGAARARQRVISLSVIVAFAIMSLLALAAVGNSISASNARATSDASAATALAAEATAVRTADEARSLALALLAQRVYEDGNPFLSAALALHANTLTHPPLEAERILAEIAYGAGARRRYLAHSQAVNALAVSRDGTFALSASSDGSIIRWDVASGEVLDVFNGHEAPIYALALSPDETQVLSGDFDGGLLLWELATRRIVQRLEGHERFIRAVAFSPDGRQALSAGSPNTAFIWTLATGNQIALEGHTALISGAAFSPDGRTVVTASFDGSIRFWDARLGDPLGSMSGNISGSITSLAWSPDARWIATGYFDGAAVLWDANARQLSRYLPGHFGAVNALRFSQDSALVASGADDGILILWETMPPPLVVSERRRYQGHTGAVNGLAFVDDAILSAANDAQLILWDVERGALWRTQPTRARIRDVAISADGEQAAALADGSLLLIPAGDGEPVRLSQHANAINCVAFVGAGERVLTGGDDTTLALYDLIGETLSRLQGHDSPVLSCAASADGALAISGDQAGQVWLWDLRTMQQIRPLVAHRAAVAAVALSPDGRRALTGSADGSMILWNTETGAQLQRFAGQHRGGDSIDAVAFGADGAWVVSGASDDTLIVWDTDTGAPLQTLRAHTGNVSSVDVSPDGRLILSGSFDGRIIVWDALRGVELRRLEGSRGQINVVRFAADGRSALSGADDGNLSWWRIDSREALIAWAEANLAPYAFTESDRDTFPIAPFGS
jgi:WD40 repeat protein